MAIWKKKKGVFQFSESQNSKILGSPRGTLTWKKNWIFYFLLIFFYLCLKVMKIIFFEVFGLFWFKTIFFGMNHWFLAILLGFWYQLLGYWYQLLGCWPADAGLGPALMGPLVTPTVPPVVQVVGAIIGWEVMVDGAQKDGIKKF